MNLKAPDLNPTISSKFHEDFEIKILALFYKDTSFYKGFCSLFKDRYFSNDQYRNIYNCINSFYQQFRRAPKYEELVNQVSARFWDTDQKVLKEAHLLTLSKLPNLEVDRNYVSSNLINFIERAEVSSLLWKAVEQVDHITVEELKTQIDRIKGIKLVDQDLGLSSKDFVHMLLAEDDEEETAIKTTFPNLDNVFGGGLQPGELVVVLAPTNRGKSQVLVNIGRGLLVGGANVVHITIGDLYVKDVMKRYMSSITNMKQDEIRDLARYRDIHKLMSEFQIFSEKELKVKFFEAGHITLMDIEAYIETLHSVEGFKTDALVLDYADLIKPPNMKVEKRHQLTDIYVGLRSLGNKLGFPVITASQTNRLGERADFKSNKEVVSAKPVALSTVHIAEDFGKAATADYILGIRRPVEYSKLKEGEQIMIMDIAKTRKSERGKYIVYKIDFNRCRMEEYNVDKEEFNTELKTKSNVDDVLE